MNRSLSDAIGECWAFDELHHERSDAIALFEAVDLRDVWMVQRRKQLRFTVKACKPVRVGRERLRQDLDGNLPFQSRVGRLVYLAHAAFAKLFDDADKDRRLHQSSRPPTLGYGETSP